MINKISVVIPCYNEEENIENTYKEVKKVLESLDKDFEIVIEQDGSTDNTEEIIKVISEKDNHVKVLSFPERRMGLGWGWRKLFEEVSGDLIIMMDADLSVKPAIINDFIKESENADIIIASRYLGAKAKMPLSRKMPSRLYYLINKILFGLDVKDSQSGFQSYRKKVIDEVKLESDGFEINLELLVKAIRRGFRIKEIPAEYVHRSQDAKFSVLKHGPNVLINTLKLYYAQRD